VQLRNRFGKGNVAENLRNVFLWEKVLIGFLLIDTRDIALKFGRNIKGRGAPWIKKTLPDLLKVSVL